MTTQTLSRMADLTRDAVTYQETRDAAEMIHQMSFGDNFYSFPQTVKAWLTNRYVFTSDPGEMLIHPLKQLADIQARGVVYGDCDDVAMLAASLLASMGYQVRFKAIILAPDGSFRHVFTEWNAGGEGSAAVWMAVDPMASGEPQYREYIVKEI